MMYRLLFCALSLCLSVPLMASDENAAKSEEKGDDGKSSSHNTLEKTAESFLGKMTGGLGGSDAQGKGKGGNLFDDFKGKNNKDGGSGTHNLLGDVGSLVSEDGKPNVKGLLEALKPQHSEGKKHYSFEDTPDTSSSEKPPKKPHKNHHKKKHENNEETTEGVKKNN